ncbi:MAG: isocitrate lyase/PEP mutase family protein [Burkholderiales bacterium]|nr:isocitrate lyase/PEP mutase family protein [Burkholderiales bacterium]
MQTFAHRRSTLARKLHAQGAFIVAPGVYDMVSARVADRFDFDCLYMTGFGVVASAYGLPDAGLATYSDMVAVVERICDNIGKPIICDGDTGYGGLLNVRHTVRGYERAGASGIQLEDQEFPKKCGHTLGRRVIPMADMERKIRVAADARTDENFQIVARTDARTGLGLDEALRRAEAYARAGADVLFVESPESEEEMAATCRRLGEACGKPLLINCVEAGRTPVLPRARLKALGYGLAIYPATSLMAAVHAMQRIYGSLLPEKDGVTLEAPLIEFKDLTGLMNFDDVYRFEAKYREI